MKKKKGIFDWSGTISDDLSLVYETCMRVMVRLGGQRMPREQFRNELVLPYMNFWHRYFPDLEEGVQRQLYQEEFKGVGAPAPFGGVVDVLRDLASVGIELAVLSSHPKEMLLAEARRYGVLGLFKEIRGSVHDKTDALTDMLRTNGFNPDETVYGGDMVHDMEVGKKAGVTTVGVCWGYDPKERLLTARPDIVVESVQDLRTVFLD